MAKPITISFDWFHSNQNLECEPNRILTGIMDTLLAQGDPIASVKMAYGTTVCVTFTDGRQFFVDLLISGKRGRPRK